MKPETPSHVLPFMGLRGMSCLMVVLCHSSQMDFGAHNTFSDAGIPAVYFFFVLSGYLLMNRGLYEIQHSRKIPPQRFCNMKMVYLIIRRIARVYPAYMTAIILYRVMIWYTHSHNFYDRYIPLFNYSIWDSLYFSGLTFHFWTMKVEMTFFVITLPVILCVVAELMIIDHKLFRCSWFSLMAPIYLLLTAYVTYIQYQNWNAKGGGELPFKIQFIAFWHGCLGGIASYYVRRFQENSGTPAKKKLWKKWLTELIAWALLIRIILENRNLVSLYTNLDPDAWGNCLFVGTPFNAALLFILDITGDMTSISRAMSVSLLRFMGETSYSVYLMHAAVIIIYKMHCGIRDLEGFFNVTVLAFFVGAVIYYLVEKTGVACGNKLIKLLKNIKSRKTRQELVEEIPVLVEEISVKDAIRSGDLENKEGFKG